MTVDIDIGLDVDTSKLEALDKRIDKLQAEDNDVDVTAKVGGERELDSLQSRLSALKDKDVEVDVDVEDEHEIDALQAKLATLSDKTVDIRNNVETDVDDGWELPDNKISRGSYTPSFSDFEDIADKRPDVDVYTGKKMDVESLKSKLPSLTNELTETDLGAGQWELSDDRLSRGGYSPTFSDYEDMAEGRRTAQEFFNDRLPDDADRPSIYGKRGSGVLSSDIASTLDELRSLDHEFDIKADGQLSWNDLEQIPEIREERERESFQQRQLRRLRNEGFPSLDEAMDILSNVNEDVSFKELDEYVESETGSEADRRNREYAVRAEAARVQDNAGDRLDEQHKEALERLTTAKDDYEIRSDDTTVNVDRRFDGDIVDAIRERSESFEIPEADTSDSREGRLTELFERVEPDLEQIAGVGREASGRRVEQNERGYDIPDMRTLDMEDASWMPGGGGDGGGGGGGGGGGDGFGSDRTRNRNLFFNTLSKAGGSFGRIKKLFATVASVNTWYSIIAALIPLLIVAGTAALGLAAALGAVAIAGAGIIGLGLLGHAGDLTSAMEEAQQEAKELGKGIFDALSVARFAFAPIQARIFDMIPGEIRKIAPDIAGLTVFEDTVVNSIRGIISWVGDLSNTLVNLEPIISQLTGRFGPIIGDVALDGIRWLIMEASENQNLLITLGEVLMDIGGALYNLMLIGAKVVAEFKWLFNTIEWLTGLLNNKAIITLAKFYVALAGLAQMLAMGASFLRFIYFTKLATQYIGFMRIAAMLLTGVMGKLGLASIAAGLKALAGGKMIAAAGYIAQAGWLPIIAILTAVIALFLALWELIGDAPLMPDFGGGMDGPGSDLSRWLGGGEPPGGSPPSATGSARGGSGTTASGSRPAQQSTTFNIYGDPDRKKIEEMRDIALGTYTTQEGRKVPERYRTGNTTTPR